MKTMGKKTTYILGLVLMVVVALSLASCHKKLGPTQVAIEDSVRHYPPIILGDELDMTYVVKNMGKEMLVITDIQLRASPSRVRKPTSVRFLQAKKHC